MFIAISVVLFLSLGNTVSASEIITVEYPSLNSDGYVTSGPYPGSWDAQHSSLRGTSVDDDMTDSWVNVSHHVSSTGYLGIQRSFLSFDTSNIPATATVVDATLKLYATEVEDKYDDEYSWVNVYEGRQANSAGKLSVSDYSLCGNQITNPEKGAPDLDLTDVADGAYVSFSLNSIGKGWIKPGKHTTLCLREGHDAENIEMSVVAPDGGWKRSRFTYATAEAGDQVWPLLEISYIAGSQDNTTPSISLVGASTMYVERGSEWVEPGYVASDAEDEEGELTIDVDGDVDIDVEGEYVLVYTVTDTGGLSASTSRTVIVEPRKARAVAFLPGITGSRLYSGPDEARGGLSTKLWESAYWFHVNELAFTNNAESERGDILTSGIVDRIRPFTGLFSYGEAYEGWLAELEAMVAAEDVSSYEVLPYDWRLAIPDLAAQGVVNEDAVLSDTAVNFMEEGEESYLISRLRSLAADSPSGKVVVVAHSMGGLLAKYLMTTLSPDDPLLDSIETIVFVGTPHLGTPKTLGELLHGSVPTAKITSREVTEDMPGPYQLVPSEAFFEAADVPVVVFDESVERDIHLDGYAGTAVDNADSLLRFLRGNDGAWNEPAVFALARPNVLSSYLLQYAHGLHAVLDRWEAPEGVQVLNVVGWNRMTPSAIRYAMKCTPAQCGKDLYFLEHTYDLAAAGDGTVYGVSGEGVEAGATWYIHMDKVNERDDTNRAHGTMLSMHDVFGVVRSAALDLAVAETDTRTMERPSEVPGWTSVVVHSPLDVHIYANGKHTGITGPGAEDELGRPYEEEVTNSYYFEWGEVKYAGVILPQDGVVLAFDGTDEGWFTLDVTVPGAAGAQKYTWPDVAVLPESEGEMRVMPGEEPVLVYDYDGDGAGDAELAPGETFEPWMMYPVSFDGLRQAVRDADMPSYAERHALSQTYAAERYAYRSRTVHRAVQGLEQLAVYVRMQVGYGRVDERKGDTVAVLAEKLSEVVVRPNSPSSGGRSRE